MEIWWVAGSSIRFNVVNQEGRCPSDLNKQLTYNDKTQLFKIVEIMPKKDCVITKGWLQLDILGRVGACRTCVGRVTRKSCIFLTASRFTNQVRDSLL